MHDHKTDPVRQRGTMAPTVPIGDASHSRLTSEAVAWPACYANAGVLPAAEWQQRGTGSDTGERLHFLDNLRTFLILLVVLCHAGGVYESSGTWASFWIVDDPSTNDLSGLLFLIADIFVMPTLFFIAGFCAPLSLTSKTAGAFIQSKFQRLVVPWLVATLALIPTYKVIFLCSRGMPQEDWSTYFHWSNGVWGQNWLWFLPVLFAFEVLFLLISRAKIGLLNMSLRNTFLGAFLIGLAYSLGMDVAGLAGWTHTGLVDFQNERLLIYFVTFLLGARCFRLKVFDGGQNRQAIYIILNSMVWIPVTVYIVFLLHPWFHPGHFIVSPFVDKWILWLNYHLSLLCLVYLMLETFRRYQNRRGWLRDELNRNSYQVYIIHVIVLGILAWSLLHTQIPSLWKCVILTASTFVASNLIVSSVRAVSTFTATWLPERIVRRQRS